MLANRDLLIYAAHAGFWACFGIAHVLTSRAAPPPDAPAADAPVTAPHSKTLIYVHAAAFAVIYMGIGSAMVRGVPAWFPGQRIVGLLVIAAGGALIAWARVWFHSWRFRAKLDAGHRLATGGPFRLVRHPIYMALNLFALGTAVWIPAPLVWIGTALMFLGSDLRGRAEERVLGQAFGASYGEYCARTSRFVPGLY